MTILSYKIKAKTDKALTETFSETHEIFDDENHVTFNHLLNKTAMSQNSVFSSVNMIITKKIIFVLNAIFQIIQLEIINSLLILIKHL